MPRAEARVAHEQDHLVHFYVDDDDLTSAATAFLAGGLVAGSAALVVCTPSHRECLETGLASTGVDVGAAEHERLLVFADAQETLARITVGGHPRAERFDAVIGGLLRELPADRPVRVIGEMVGLLWEAGDIEGAATLELLWNELGRRRPFSLLCAYPAALGSDPEAVSAVCDAHTSVLAMAPGPDGMERSDAFLCNPESPRAARRFVSSVLNQWGRAEARDDIMIIASELATNAVMHARSHFTVGLHRQHGLVRIAVGDNSDAAPRRQWPDVSTVGGRGLAMVDAIAAAWGYDRVAGGKVVWADVPVGARQEAAEGRR